MSKQNNSFENSPTEIIEAPVASETREMPPVTPPPEAVGWVSEPKPEEEEEKSKKGLVIATTIVAVLLAGTGIAYAAGAFSPAPAGNTNAASNAVAVKPANANANANANASANTNAEPENKAAEVEGKDDDPNDGRSGFSSEPSSGSTSQDGNSTSQGGSSSQSGGSSSAQRVWVVDRAAYTETVHHPAQGYQTPVVYYTACTLCGAELTDPYSHRKSVHPTADSMGWTYTSRGGEWVETSPAWDEQVYHDEVGHWEYR